MPTHLAFMPGSGMSSAACTSLVLLAPPPLSGWLEHMQAVLVSEPAIGAVALLSCSGHLAALWLLLLPLPLLSVSRVF